GPDEMSRDPDPAGPAERPEPGPPGKAPTSIKPGAGDVEVVVGWRGDGWSALQRTRRRRQVVQIVLVPVGPEAGSPLPAVIDLLPVTRQPATSGRRLSPKAADPNEVLSLIIPLPVARNPLDVPFRLLVRRDFVHRPGRRLRNDRRRAGLVVEWFRIG